jgi:uncharacterized protein YxeA
MKKTLLTISVLVGTFCLSVPAAYASNPDNKNSGGNGIVKINNEDAPDKIPTTHPRVTNCTFSVDFYNYDKNNNKATVAFELQSPTNSKDHTLKVSGGSLTPAIGSDNAGGSKDHDASEKYVLTFTGKAQDKQGYHVKVTVNAPGSKGEDKKQKVYWVDCASPQVQGSQTRSDLPHTGLNMTSAIGVSGVIAFGGYLTSYLRQRRARNL